METQKLVPVSFIQLCRDEVSRKSLTSVSSQMLFARNNDMTWPEMQRWIIRTSDDFNKAVKEIDQFDAVQRPQNQFGSMKSNQ